MVNIISGTISFSDIHKYTKEHGVTITEFFAALLLQVHIEKQRKVYKYHHILFLDSRFR